MIKLRVEAPWKPEELPHETEDEGPRPADVHGDVGRPADGPGGCEEAPHDEQAPIFRGVEVIAIWNHVCGFSAVDPVKKKVFLFLKLVGSWSERTWTVVKEGTYIHMFFFLSHEEADGAWKRLVQRFPRGLHRILHLWGSPQRIHGTATNVDSGLLNPWKPPYPHPPTGHHLQVSKSHQRRPVGKWLEPYRVYSMRLITDERSMFEYVLTSLKTVPG